MKKEQELTNSRGQDRIRLSQQFDDLEDQHENTIGKPLVNIHR